jgi:hypothetical protein
MNQLTTAPARAIYEAICDVEGKTDYQYKVMTMQVLDYVLKEIEKEASRPGVDVKHAAVMRSPEAVRNVVREMLHRVEDTIDAAIEQLRND